MEELPSPTQNNATTQLPHNSDNDLYRDFQHCLPHQELRGSPKQFRNLQFRYLCPRGHFPNKRVLPTESHK